MAGGDLDMYIPVSHEFLPWLLVCLILPHRTLAPSVQSKTAQCWGMCHKCKRSYHEGSTNVDVTDAKGQGDAE